VRKVVVGLLSAAMVTSVGVILPTVASAAPPVAPTAVQGGQAPLDDLVSPLEAKRRDLRQQALNGILKGTIKPENRNGSVVAKVGRNQYVELSPERNDRIFVILAEFGNERYPGFPDVDSDPSIPGPTTFDGPLHNAIPEPDRSKDNTTIWQADYSQAHYQQLYFGTGAGVESLKTYYETQSSGRYSVDGEVSDWVKVNYNEARYGRNCTADGVCGDAQALVADAANAWVADQKASGRTEAQIQADLAGLDQYDRYDYDGDGNFNEPDGYIDHFQIVHAGGDESDGDPQQGEDAIWAHRSYVNGSGRGSAGPTGNLLGGTQIGDTGMWIGDYTMQPENGGLSVFAHEYGHDLGLPDDYDTSGAANSNNEYWTLMSQSRLNGAGEPIGTRPGDIGAWNKLQLGWLAYANVTAGDTKVVNLGPQEYNTRNFQAAVVTLPDKQVTTDLGAPFAGTKQYFSGNADDLNTSLGKTVDLSAATTASLRLKGRYNIEQDYDYLYVEASTDGGSTWTALPGTVGGAPFGEDGGHKPALTGAQTAWTDIVVPLDAYAGQKPVVRLHYVTDGGVSAGGFFGDDLTLVTNGTAGTPDGAEGVPTWTSSGFSAVGASTSKAYPNFYIAGYRSYLSYDKYLQTGPYNFGWLSTNTDWVEHFAYQQGLLISYNDTSYSDNNTAQHPGGGRNLIVDAHPAPFAQPNGTLYRSRVMIYDAPFGLTRTDPMVLHTNGQAALIRGLPAQPLFDDSQQYYYPENPTTVKLPAVGVKIRVLTETGQSMKILIS
jgi:immune inhibitor A